MRNASEIRKEYKLLAVTMPMFIISAIMTIITMVSMISGLEMLYSNSDATKILSRMKEEKCFD